MNFITRFFDYFLPTILNYSNHYKNHIFNNLIFVLSRRVFWNSMLSEFIVYFLKSIKITINTDRGVQTEMN